MSLQSRSSILTVPSNPEGRNRAGTGQGHTDQPLIPSLQSLAAELHQAATEGIFEYRRNWVLASRIASLTLVLIAAGNLAIAGYPVVFSGESVGWQVAGGLLGMFMAVTIAAFLCNLVPSLQVTPEGLRVSELYGWRRIPWQQVQTLRVMELSKNRYMVMVPIRGSTRPRTPAPMLKIVPALLGASRKGESGVIFTSSIRNFERLLQLLVAYMGQTAGQAMPAIEAFVDEDSAMPMAQMFLHPPTALARLSHRPQLTEMSLDAFGTPRPETGPSVPWGRVLARQVAIAAVPALLLCLEMLTDKDAQTTTAWQLSWTGAVLLLGVIELPFIAKLLQTVGDLMVGRGQFRLSMRAYLELQAPRVALLLVGMTLVASGLPSLLAQVLWLTGIGLTTVLCTEFVKRLYFIPTSQALLASVGTFLFQISLFAIYFITR